MKPEYIIDYKLFKPSSTLAPYIKYCIYIHFRNEGQKIWFPADLRNQLLFLIDGNARLELEKNTISQPRLAVRGTFTNPVTVSFTTSEIKVYTIEFKESGIYNLLDIEGKELLNKFKDVRELIRNSVLEAPQSNETESIHRHFEQELTKLIDKSKLEKSRPFDKVIKLCHKKEGQISVEQLSEMTSIQSRTLNRYFIRYTGISPKKFLHQIKIRQLLSELMQKEKTKGSHLAEKYGLYDESHLIRVIRKHTGASPKKIEDFDTSWFKFIRNNESNLS